MKRRNFLTRLLALPAAILAAPALVAAAPACATGTIICLAGRDWTENQRLPSVCCAEEGLRIAEDYHRALLIERGIASSEAYAYVGDAGGAWWHTIYWDGERVARTSWPMLLPLLAQSGDPRAEPNVTRWRTGIGPGGRAVNVPVGEWGQTG